MITDPYLRGQAFCLLGFRAAEMLLGQLRLRLDQPQRLRELVLETAPYCTAAAYDARNDLWAIHYDALYGHVVLKVRDWLGPDDIAALERWFQRGIGHHSEDDATNFWFDVVTRVGGEGYDTQGLAEPQIAALDALITGVWNDWRDGTYEVLCEAFEDADLTPEEEALETRFNVNFLDDVLDPLLVFDNLRKGNILHQHVDALEAELPWDSMHRLADAWLATAVGRGWARQRDAAQIDVLRADIRTIRAGAA